MTEITITDVLQSIDIVALSGRDNTIEFSISGYSFGGSSSTSTAELLVKSSIDDDDANALLDIYGTVAGIESNEITIVVTELELAGLTGQIYYFKLIVGTVILTGNFYVIEKKILRDLICPGTLSVFYFGHDDIFDELSRQTHYAAATLKNDAGASIIDDVAISENEDEKTWFYDKINRTASDVYQIVSNYGQTVENAYFSDAQLIGSEQNYIRYALVFPSEFDDNLLKKLHQNLRDAIITYLKRLWFSDHGFEEKAMLGMQYYEQLVDVIQRSLSSRKTKPRVSYRGF